MGLLNFFSTISECRSNSKISVFPSKFNESNSKFTDPLILLLAATCIFNWRIYSRIRLILSLMIECPPAFLIAMILFSRVAFGVKLVCLQLLPLGASLYAFRSCHVLARPV